MCVCVCVFVRVSVCAGFHREHVTWVFVYFCVCARVAQRKRGRETEKERVMDNFACTCVAAELD